LPYTESSKEERERNPDLIRLERLRLVGSLVREKLTAARKDFTPPRDMRTPEALRPFRANPPRSARPWSIRELDAPQNRGRPLPPRGALLLRVFLAMITPNSRSVDRGCVRTPGDCWSQRLGPRSAHVHRSTYHGGQQADLLVPARL
jgi:hypothetical protein